VERWAAAYHVGTGPTSSPVGMVYGCTFVCALLCFASLLSSVFLVVYSFLLLIGLVNSSSKFSSTRRPTSQGDYLDED